MKRTLFLNDSFVFLHIYVQFIQLINVSFCINSKIYVLPILLSSEDFCLSMNHFKIILLYVANLHLCVYFVLIFCMNCICLGIVRNCLWGGDN